MTIILPQSYLNASLKKEQLRRRLEHAHEVKASKKTGSPRFADALDTNSVDTDVSQAVDSFDAEYNMGRIDGLDYETWLPFAAKVYNISPRIEDYILVNTLICPSDIPNRNGIAFPATELARFMPPPTNRMAYKAWAGCPVHYEHDNEVHERAYGVIFDSILSRVTGYGGSKLWKVMGLLGIDKNKYPDIAQKVLTKEINTYSMGALVDRFSCGYCGTECSKEQVCSHIAGTDMVNWKKHQDYDGSYHLSFLNAHGISPIECSIVVDPAWAPALSDQVFELK